MTEERTIESVIEKLKLGNANFVEDKLDGKLQDSGRRVMLTSGQDPYAIILSCSDSRVVPELAFDAGLGELFVIRVAGNVTNISSIASIEYAVANLGTPVLVVIGHENCGAVTAAVNGADGGPHIKTLLSYINPAIEASGEGAGINDVVKKNALLMVERILRKSTICSEAVEQGKLKILPAYYHLDSGKIDYL
jgi:carbonic anhydrase